MILEITKDNFEELVLKSDKPVLVDFYAEWCGPCKQLLPVLENVATKYEDTAYVYKLNVDGALDISVDYGIRSIPASVFFKNGEEAERYFGKGSEKTYSDILDTLLKS